MCGTMELAGREIALCVEQLCRDLALQEDFLDRSDKGWATWDYSGGLARQV
jgi:hypothetical protein